MSNLPKKVEQSFSGKQTIALSLKVNEFRGSWKEVGLTGQCVGRQSVKTCYIWGRVGSLGSLKHREGRFKLL